MAWNVLDFPSGVVKFGKESGKNILPYDDEGDFMLQPAPNVSFESPLLPTTTALGN